MYLTFPIVLCATILTNCRDVATATFEKQSGIPFEITGSVTYVENDGSPFLNVADRTGGTMVVDIINIPFQKTIRDGDILRIGGVVLCSTNGLTSARCRQLRFIRHEDPPPPVKMDFTAFNIGRLDCHNVHVQGELMEVFTDEIDPRYVYTSLNCHGSIVYLTFRENGTTKEKLLHLRGAVVTAIGTVSRGTSRARRSLGRTISCQALSNLTINTPPPQNAFSVPFASFECSNSAHEILSIGRRRAIGTVIAIRSDRRIYLRENEDATRCVTLATDRMPNYGKRIEVAGLPETDFFRINLTDADWQPIESEPFSICTTDRVSIAHLLTDEQGRPRITHTHHGRLVRLEGLIIDQPNVEGHQNILTLKDGELIIPIELTSAMDALSKTSVGCQIAVTGICIVETETWRPTAGFPHATGVVIVPRSAEDIVVLSRPNWWTPRRFIILIAVLLGLIIVILVWNHVLQSIIRRKSHLLMLEQHAKLRSELRIRERTNLAVELHDALSQNLTGLTFQLATVRSALAIDPDALPKHLDTAERMLVSCRTELKRCLSDLRDNTLDEKDFAVAIQRTIIPVVGTATVNIKVTVPRQNLNDTTVHSILCIIRELVTNAVLHGCATQLYIHGETDGHRLKFSVADNGHGFDPTARPGPAEGHFGLDGIRERVEHLNGNLSIDSAPGRGTCITISEITL